MKKLHMLLLALVAWSGCLAPPRDSDVVNLSALDFGTATDVAMAGIQGTSNAVDAFHGYRRIAGWHAPTSTAAGAELAAILAETIRTDLALARQPRKPGEETLRLHSFCIFNPGYAIRLTTNRGARDFLVCLDCNEVRVYDRAGHFWEHQLDKNFAARLAALLAGS